MLAAQDPWPKRLEDPRGTVVMYQPQLEDYQDAILTARVLPGHTHGMLSFFRKPRIIHNPCPSGRCRGHHPARQASSDNQPIPGALTDELLQRLDIASVTGGNPCRIFTASFQEKSLNIKGSPTATFGSAQHEQKRLKKSLQATTGLEQFLSVHAPHACTWEINCQHLT